MRDESMILTDVWSRASFRRITDDTSARSQGHQPCQCQDTARCSVYSCVQGGAVQRDGFLFSCSSLGAPERMRRVMRWMKTRARNPLLYEPPELLDVDRTILPPCESGKEP